jgi:ATP-binding cassette, subfamily B, bacterial PglK
VVDAIRKLWVLLSRREKIQFVGLFFLLLIGAVLETIGVGAIPAFVVLLSDPERVQNYPVVVDTLAALGITETNQMLIAATVALMGIFLVKNAYLVALEYAKGRFTLNREVTLKDRLFEQYLREPYAYHLDKNTSTLLRNVKSEVGRAISGTLMPLLMIGMEILVLAMIFTLLIVTEPVVTLIAFVGFGGTGYLFYRLIRERIAAAGREDQDAGGKMIRAVNEGLGGLKDTKVLGREHYFHNTFHRESLRSARAQLYKKLTNAFPRAFLETLCVFGLLIVALLFVIQDRPLQTLIPTLALFGAAAIRMLPSFTRLVSAFPQFRYYKPALDTVHGDLIRAQGASGEEDGVTRRPRAAKLAERAHRFHGPIRLEGVHYSYPNSHESALRGLSLEIPENAMVGFVGPSGAGKTTAVDVILGLLAPDRGRVTVGGVDIQDGVRDWQHSLGYIPQHIFLTDASVRRNVAFGMADKEIDDERVWRALESAQLAEHIRSLPAGLETVVGERGIRLSGGQRQRIGIARALYHDPPVLVMDEATSAVDNETERGIIAAIEALRGERTIVMIAHRLTTVMRCDQLHLFDAGKIVDAGSYDELVGRSRQFGIMAEELPNRLAGADSVSK